MALNPYKNSRTIQVTLGATFASGAPILVGSLVGICSESGVSGDSIAVFLHECWTVNKVSAQAWTQGVKLYWDDTAKLFTTSSNSGANALAGVAEIAAANPSATGVVRLNGTAA